MRRFGWEALQSESTEFWVPKNKKGAIFANKHLFQLIYLNCKTEESSNRIYLKKS